MLFRSHTHSVYFESIKTIDGVLNHMIVAPAHKPVCSCAIKEVVFAGAGPYEVPWVLGIDGDDAAAMGVCRLECSC